MIQLRITGSTPGTHSKSITRRATNAGCIIGQVAARPGLPPRRGALTNIWVSSARSNGSTKGWSPAIDAEPDWVGEPGSLRDPGSPNLPPSHPEDRPSMYPSKDARELAILLRISRELDIVGDVTATVDNPSELLAWAAILTDATIAAWRGQDSGHRYLQVTAAHRRAPVHGRITAVLPCEQHQEYWQALDLDQLGPGQTRNLNATDLSEAWSTMPLAPPEPKTTKSGPSNPKA